MSTKAVFGIHSADRGKRVPSPAEKIKNIKKRTANVTPAMPIKYWNLPVNECYFGV